MVDPTQITSIECALYERFVDAVWAAGYHNEITWQETVSEPIDAVQFAAETAYVICNSGMKQQIARRIFDRVMDAIDKDLPVLSAFKHPGKAAAIQKIWGERHVLFDRYLKTNDQVEFLAALPWIGPITKWHLAKNFGIDVVKPDRHLQRIADYHRETPEALCLRLGIGYGHAKPRATADYVLWRCCNLGVIDSQTMRYHLGTTDIIR